MHENEDYEKISHRKPPLRSLCFSILTWSHICSHVTSYMIIAKHKTHKQERVSWKKKEKN